MTVKSDDNGSEDGRIVRYTARSGLEGPADFPSDAVAAVILTGLPDSAHLSGGFALGRGAWAVRAEDMTTLSIFSPPPARDALSADLTFLLRDASGEARPHSTTGAIILDPANVGSAAARHTTVPLDLEQIVESLLVGRLLYDLTVSGLPAGAALTHGEANIDGSWTLSARDLRAGPVAVELPQTFQGSLILAFAAMTAGPFGDIELRTRWTTVEVESAEPI